MQTAQCARHQLLNSLPISNKWRHSGRYTKRPTAKVVAQTVSNGMLDGSTTCRSCELAYSKLYMFNSNHSSTTIPCQSKCFLWEVKQLSRSTLAIFPVTFPHGMRSRVLTTLPGRMSKCNLSVMGCTGFYGNHTQFVEKFFLCNLTFCLKSSFFA